MERKRIPAGHCVNAEQWNETQHYQGFCWVSLSLNPTLYLRGMLEEVVATQLGSKTRDDKKIFPSDKQLINNHPVHPQILDILIQTKNISI